LHTRKISPRKSVLAISARIIQDIQMLLKIDPKSATQFSLINEISGELRVTDHRKCYITGEDRLALLVLCNGLDLATVTGQVVDAVLGWGKAAEPFARPGEVGKCHITITCYRMALNAHSHGPMGKIRSLSSILKYAPKRTS
jgi:hypothetical protein